MDYHLFVIKQVDLNNTQSSPTPSRETTAATEAGNGNASTTEYITSSAKLQAHMDTVSKEWLTWNDTVHVTLKPGDVLYVPRFWIREVGFG